MSETSTLPIRSTCYFSVNNPENPISVRKAATRKEEFLLLEAHLPDDDADHDTVVASLMVATGETWTALSNILLSFIQLHELPLLNELQHLFYHLDFKRLIAISNALAGLNPENLPEVDRLLTEFLTPTAPNQVLPSARAIGYRIKAIRASLDDVKATGEHSTQDEASFGIDFTPEGLAEVGATIDAADGHIINEAVRAHARQKNISPGAAFVDLIRGHVNVKVVLNIYSAKDLENPPVWMGGVGFLDTRTGELWKEKATHTRCMDQARHCTTEAHDPPAELRAAIAGRDGTCRFPGCCAPVNRCQVDHRVNHADGGETCLENCAMLCQRHHNMKTDGRVRYFMDPLTGIIVWLFVDGTWAITTPQGPLSAENARWAQSMAQHRAKHHERWAKKNAEEAEARKIRIAAETAEKAELDASEPPF